MINIETLYGYRTEDETGVNFQMFNLETKSRLNHIPMNDGKMFDLVFLHTDFMLEDRILLRMVYND